MRLLQLRGFRPVFITAIDGVAEHLVSGGGAMTDEDMLTTVDFTLTDGACGVADEDGDAGEFGEDAGGGVFACTGGTCYRNQFHHILQIYLL